ncbi:hypothetical protein [Corallococcus aberystwythensis]|uniref:Prenyltransferase n=1 Tax=Corallococcus aberystwythensis TaxID=2316722 RepID=A0A3A8QN86_9BACT|nr:hypothetical protein [Corallococcus aberystwythensis]RKH64644.1 hypothetical protein D7W81_18110 [Corallococcus aberystwythensis]
MSRSITDRARATLRFSVQRYPPLFYLLAISLWCVCLDGMLGGGLTFSPDLLHVALSIFGVGYFMRVADELRDYEYDLVHNPDRGLAKGEVSFGDLYVALGICAVVLLGTNLAVSWARAAILAGIMAHALFLWWLEKHWGAYQNSMFLMIGVAIHLHVGHGLYLWVAHAERIGQPLNPQGLLAVVGVVCLYLHWEVMRKTAWAGSTKPGEKLYSDEVGSTGSALIAFALNATAVGLFLWLTKPWHSHVTGWLFLLPLGMAIVNLTLFFKDRRPRALSGRLAGRTYFAFLFVMLVAALT